MSFDHQRWWRLREKSIARLEPQATIMVCFNRCAISGATRGRFETSTSLSASIWIGAWGSALKAPGEHHLTPRLRSGSSLHSVSAHNNRISEGGDARSA
jgi:hypothetical protein